MSEFYLALQELFVGHPLWFLFASGFLSATLLPGSSELSLYAALSLNSPPTLVIILVATLGNTLGGMTNYFLGLLLPNRTISQKRGQQLTAWFQRYGYWALLLSWLPIVGDPLCAVAGWLRMNSTLCLVFIAVGKALRYAFLALVFKGLM
ncbi:MAG: YqaA family protein [Vibrio sp.]